MNEEADIMAYQRKTVDEYVLLGNWGYGFDEILVEDNAKDIRTRLREYVKNDPRATYRIHKRRVPIDKKPLL